MAEAAQYGEARAKSVIGKAMAKFPELRSSAKEVMPLIAEVVAEANQMDSKALDPFLPENKEKPKSRGRSKKKFSSKKKSRLEIKPMK